MREDEAGGGFQDPAGVTLKSSSSPFVMWMLFVL
jgi:hypothetical protein